MTKIDFLDSLAEFTKDAVKDVLLPVKPQEENDMASERAATVYKMRLPDRNSATKKAPYILHQIVTGKDSQAQGKVPESKVTVRTVFCVYSPSEDAEGSMNLLTLMERLRITMLISVCMGEFYRLDKEAGIEQLIYPEDTAPYYVGEMVSVWNVPPIEMEVFNWLHENNP